MVLMNIEENIKKMSEQVEKMRQDALRLEGSIKMLMALKEGGLKEVDLPDVKNEESEESEENEEKVMEVK